MCWSFTFHVGPAVNILWQKQTMFYMQLDIHNDCNFCSLDFDSSLVSIIIVIWYCSHLTMLYENYSFAFDPPTLNSLYYMYVCIKHLNCTLDISEEIIPTIGPVLTTHPCWHLIQSNRWSEQAIIRQIALVHKGKTHHQIRWIKYHCVLQQWPPTSW